MSTITSDHRYWRFRVFIITWIGYAGFYMCRKNFAVAKMVFPEEFGFTNWQLSQIWTGYLLMYAIGQFVNGFLGDVRGPRFMVGLGLLVSAGMNFLCGFGDSVGYFAIVLGINGFAQSTGWPGLVKCMGNWFIVRERGRVMGWWGTCFAVGGLFATLYATRLWQMYAARLTASSGAEAAEALAWKIVFFGPAITLTVLALVYIITVRNRPTDVGLAELDEYEGMSDEEVQAAVEAPPVLSPEEEKIEFRAALRTVFTSRTVWTICGVYFFLKFIRYGMLSWLPKYAKDELMYPIADAGYLSVGFELAAPLGVLFCGYMSDKMFGSRRGPIATICIGVVVLACLLQSQIAYWNMYWYFLGLCLLGFTVFGPDALLSGPAAQDFGSKRAAGMCAGMINGVGSLGAVLQEPLIGWATKTYDNAWSWLFYVFAGLALIATVLIATTWNDVPKIHQEQRNSS